MVKKVNKRKLPPDEKDFDQRALNAKQSYFDRIFHQCSKDLYKQIKIARTFECQKVIRKLKELNKIHTNEDGANNKQIEKLGTRLQKSKEFSLEPVIQECFRRLGILQLNPSWSNGYSNRRVDVSLGDPNLDTDDTISPGSDIDDKGSQEQDLNSANVLSLNDDRPEQSIGTTDILPGQLSVDERWIKDRILQHKKLQSAIEKWNDKLTEFRRWCLHQDEKYEFDPDAESGGKKSRTKVTASNTATASLNNLNASLFVKLGSENEAAPNDDEVNGNYYGPAGSVPKKNRAGQRARRAKVMAINAKKEGRRIEKSMNWREPKEKNDDQNGENAGQGQNSARHVLDSTIKMDDNNGNNDGLHPSWQARKTQQQGIVAFEGKKITFD